MPPTVPPVLKFGKITFAVWRLGDGRFAFDYHDGTRRKVVARTRFEDLKTAAGDIATKLMNGETEALQLSPQDCRIHIAARELLAPHSLEIDAAARIVADCAAVLGSPHRLIEAARWFAQANPAGNSASFDVPGVVEDFLRSRSGGDLSEVYLRKLRAELRNFAAAFPGPIAAVRSTAIEDWLNDQRQKRTGQPLSVRRRRNLLANIVTLFNFARDLRGCIPPGLRHEAEKIRRPRVRRGHVAIWTLDELRLLLDHAREPELPIIVIGAFAGLRSAEIGRLEWSDIRWEQGIIRISGLKSKTGEPRTIPMQENLRAWLAPYRSHHGPVCPASRLDNLLKAVLTRAGLVQTGKRRHNALRHSFGTYFAALTKNIPEVAFVMGNSPSIVKRNYLEAVTEQEAKSWFQIKPADKSNVLPLRFAS